jgi:hypothetical protein
MGGQSTTNDDGWDWPWILFIGRKELQMTEEEIWESTPAKFFALLECALEYNRVKAGVKNKQQTTKKVVKEGFIDKISGW